MVTAQYVDGVIDEKGLVLANADVNRDNVIDINDAVIINNKLNDTFNGQENMLLNGSFYYESDYWAFYTNETGDGSMVIVNEEAKIYVTNQGDAVYYIGLAQGGVELQKGAYYELTFEARSPEVKTIRSVFQYNDTPWTLYTEKYHWLDNEMRTFKHIFIMEHDSYSKADFSMHIGNAGNGTIYFDNFRLRKLDNLIVNSSFNEGTEDWGLYSDQGSDAAMSVEDGEAQIAIMNQGSEVYHIGLSQGDITLQNGSAYELSFDARASSDKKVRSVLQLNWSPWIPYAVKDHEITTEMKRYKHLFQMESWDNYHAGFNLQMGKTGSGQLYVDNIRLKKIENLLNNSCFSNGVSAPWTTYAEKFHSLTTENKRYKHIFLMEHETDLKAGLCINAGNTGTGDIYLDNMILRKL